MTRSPRSRAGDDPAGRHRGRRPSSPARSSGEQASGARGPGGTCSAAWPSCWSGPWPSASSLTQGDEGQPRPRRSTTTTDDQRPRRPTCPLTGTPAPGRPSRPARPWRSRSATTPATGRRPASTRPTSSSRSRSRAPSPGWWPSSSARARPWSGTSARPVEPDAGILSQLSEPDLRRMPAGSTRCSPCWPVAAHRQEHPARRLRLGHHPSLGPRTPPTPRSPNTAALWALDPARHHAAGPDLPLLGHACPPGSVAGSGASVHIPFSSTSDVTWTWSAADRAPTCAPTPACPTSCSTARQTAATNVVVMTVQTVIGLVGREQRGRPRGRRHGHRPGPLVVLRNGVAITGTWTRPALTQPATLTGRRRHPDHPAARQHLGGAGAGRASR